MSTNLDPAGKAAWLRLKRHLEWCGGFALVFLFSDQPAVIDRLREHLADLYRARVTGLKVQLPETPQALLTELLPRLLDPPRYRQALDAPVWLDLTRPPTGLPTRQQAAWREAGLAFLARLNEQREPLRRTLRKPLILVLPPAEKARIKSLAPDLWAIRHFTLETGPWLAPAPHPAPERPTARPEPFPLSDTEQSLVQEWRRLKDKGSTERGALLAGGRAFDALLHRGRIGEANEAAAWLVETVRSRLAHKPEDPETLRDLSIALDNLGHTDQVLSDWPAARANFTEGLEIARHLAGALPEHPDYKDLPARFEHRLAELEAARGQERD
ncbi:MAG: hypothetical protein LGR52_14710 [Candidatus Thiosymbion ectosymbiont of Robbea hypermnestra]|nr:hypothetical protein [Candidatus Thiosymbion ectosymbiont of Robbea hypermnestra]